MLLGTAPYLLFEANSNTSGKLAKGRHTGKFIPDGNVKVEGFCIVFFCRVDRQRGDHSSYWKIIWRSKERKKLHNSKHVPVSEGIKQKDRNSQLHHHINRVRVEVMYSLLFALRGGKTQLYIYLIYIWLFITNSNKIVVYGICVSPKKKKSNQCEFPEKRHGRRRYHFWCMSTWRQTRRYKKLCVCALSSNDFQISCVSTSKFSCSYLCSPHGIDEIWKFLCILFSVISSYSEVRPLCSKFLKTPKGDLDFALSHARTKVSCPRKRQTLCH